MIKIANWLLLIPFAGIFATVFVIDPTLGNGIVSGKYFWFILCMGFVTIGALFSYFLGKKKVHYTMGDLLLLILVVFGVAFTSIQNGSLTTRPLLLLLLLILYFCFRVFLSQQRKYVLVLVVLLILTGFVESVWGLKQLYGYSASQHQLFKTTGSFYNPGPYAGYLAVLFPLAFYAFLLGQRNIQDPNKQRQIVWKIITGVAGVSLVSILLILPATMSRASWLAAAGGSLIVLLYCFADRWTVYYKKHNKLFITLSLVVVMFLGAALAGIYFLKKDSADGRALMWKVSLRIIPEYPLGVGLGNFPGVYGQGQIDYFLSGEGTEEEEHIAGNPEYAFNEYLQIAIEWGVVPFVFFLVIIGRSIYIAFKRRKIGLLSSLVALLIFASMSYPFSVLPFLIVLVFLLSAIETGENMSKSFYPELDSGSPEKLQRSNFPDWLSCTIILICILVSGFCMFRYYPVYQAYKSWNKARVYHNVSMSKEAASTYEILYPLLNDQVQFLFEYAQNLSRAERYEESNAVIAKALRISCDPMFYNVMGKNYQAMKEYDLATQYLRKSCYLVPNRLYPYYLLAKLYQEMGEVEKMKEVAAIVLTKEPKVDSRAVMEMREEMEKIIREEDMEKNTNFASAEYQ